MDRAYHTWLWVLAAGAAVGVFFSPRSVALASVGLFAASIAGLIAAGALGYGNATMLFGLAAMAIPVLGIIATAAESHDVASQCETTDGVVYVPALLGLGTPRWDYGARGTLLGLTRGSERPQIVRAVLEGVAQRGADLVDAAETDTGLSIPSLRVDGGMSENPTFVQALADAAQRPVEVSPVKEATTLGAAFLAGLAVGTWASWDDIAATWAPRRTVEPGAPLDRERWGRACERAAGWIPELSSLSF